MSDAERLSDLLLRWEELKEQGQPVSLRELCADCPELLPELRGRVEALASVNNWLCIGPAEESPTPIPASAALPSHAPLASESVAPPTSTSDAEIPAQIGRYHIERLLGKGGFGRVYLARDEELHRFVAVKVPHPDRARQPRYAETYLSEARILARLDHPHIVPVYDVGRTQDGLPFVVSKFIEGCDLSPKSKPPQPSFAEAAELVAAIAEALHYAHRKGLVHRDIKPANILIDVDGRPYVADFGLALREEDFGKGIGFAGTLPYMSPEQARGEGHRVDGRSDIYSLGVVFYELITGRRPFETNSREDLREQIIHVEVRPPRQIDDRIPKELERICLKALSKRASERYTTAKDMGDDLRHFLAAVSTEKKTSFTDGVLHNGEVGIPLPSLATISANQKVVKIIPKGLRSFDAADADFFLELLPGPRDRDGLPDSIRFWTSRIETTDADNTFAVGLIYGPSGCGKSSLVKAGLLPRLPPSVTTVYVEAAGNETEARLLKCLRRLAADLTGERGLIESLAALRQGSYLQAGQKVLLVLDQFEQWLHAKRGEVNPELVQALRQCDGGRLQCIVLIRDDFWMATTRFMASLETTLVQNQNCFAVDLFDLLHARKVLAAFGRAYGCLPENFSQCSQEQNAFLDQAIAGLAEDDKVSSVRLALFAEMVKGKLWIPATLDEVGGIEGVGVTFLEETFTASTAPPAHRLHHKAAQAVLKQLLPEAWTDIKGHMRSQQELLQASGYAGRPLDFEDLMRILDSEVRLITPTDPEGNENADPSTIPEGASYYQLTHDYLVPSLREWLTRKQKETRRGRAELLLADRVAIWNARPENRQLPSLWQWFQIQLLTAKKRWTPPQCKMMAKAARYHALQGTLVVALMSVAIVSALNVRAQVEEQRNAAHAAGMVQALIKADTSKVADIIAQMTDYRKWTDPMLREEYNKAAANSQRKLHASLALLPVDDSQVDYLFERLLNAQPREVSVIRDALTPHREVLRDKLWRVVEAPVTGKKSQRLRAASALAKFDPDSTKWEKVQESVANDLVDAPSVYLAIWMDSLRPVRTNLLPPLSVVYRDKTRQVAERSLVADILADYAADQPEFLAELLMDADHAQFAAIYSKVKAQRAGCLAVLFAELAKTLPSDLPSSNEQREKLAKRQANAAVALLRMKQAETVWPLLKHSPDPRLRSYLIHLLSPLGANAGAIIKHLDEEQDLTIRRALILSLGEYSDKELSPEARDALLPKLQDIYRSSADPGLHAAVEWLLRTWHQQAWLKKINVEWAKFEKERAKRLESIRWILGKDKEKSPPQWYVNNQGQTMVVIPGPIHFVMGSPSTEVDREDDERQHTVLIDRTFVLAAKPVTMEQYRQFEKEFKLPAVYMRGADLPVVGTSWHQAAAYCNWLSKMEGINEDQWCYEIKDGQVIQLKVNYLSLTGYRLPTEAEMEYAIRAGAVTSRYYGETEELLSKYAWFNKNSQYKTWPVGSLKPNDLGLFDMQGNAYGWCQERYQYYPQGKEGIKDKEDIYIINELQDRVLRGGSSLNPVSNVRSADRIRYMPSNRPNHIGFRLARTFR